MLILTVTHRRPYLKVNLLRARWFQDFFRFRGNFFPMSCNAHTVFIRAEHKSNGRLIASLHTILYCSSFLVSCLSPSVVALAIGNVRQSLMKFTTHRISRPRDARIDSTNTCSKNNCDELSNLHKFDAQSGSTRSVLLGRRDSFPPPPSLFRRMLLCKILICYFIAYLILA